MVWSVKFCFFFKFNFWWALLGDHTRNSLIVSWKSFRWKMALCAMSEENGPFFAQFSQNSLQQFALFPHVTYKFRANINESLTDSWLKSFFFMILRYAVCNKQKFAMYIFSWVSIYLFCARTHDWVDLAILFGNICSHQGEKCQTFQIKTNFDRLPMSILFIFCLFMECLHLPSEWKTTNTAFSRSLHRTMLERAYVLAIQALKGNPLKFH